MICSIRSFTGLPVLQRLKTKQNKTPQNFQRIKVYFLIEFIFATSWVSDGRVSLTETNLDLLLPGIRGHVDDELLWKTRATESLR